MSATAIDNKLWEVYSYMMHRVGVDAASRMMSPLNWYINTGRASGEFLRAFCSAKAFVMARVLAKGGSDDEIIQRLKAKLRG